MEYISTRNKNQSYSFKDIFLRGLAPDGGLFIPKNIKIYNDSEIKKLSELSYIDLATEIIFNFCQSDIKKSNLKNVVEKSYKSFSSEQVINISKVGDINLVELYHGPTLAFKDIAMQVLGNMYDELQVAANKTVKKTDIIIFFKYFFV